MLEWIYLQEIDFLFLVKATAKAVAFTGHREISNIHQEQVRERLKEAVLQAIHQGVSKFYCGMALGFDMMAAEEVLSLKLSIPMLKLVAVVPFKGQSASWSMVEQQRYAYILSKADDVVPGPWWSSSGMPISFPRRTMWCI